MSEEILTFLLYLYGRNGLINLGMQIVIELSTIFLIGGLYEEMVDCLASGAARGLSGCGYLCRRQN